MPLSPFVLFTCHCYPAGDIKVLKKCTQLTKVDMFDTKVQGTMELSSSSCEPVRFSWNFQSCVIPHRRLEFS